MGIHKRSALLYVDPFSDQKVKSTYVNLEELYLHFRQLVPRCTGRVQSTTEIVTRRQLEPVQDFEGQNQDNRHFIIIIDKHLADDTRTDIHDLDIVTSKIGELLI